MGDKWMFPNGIVPDDIQCVNWSANQSGERDEICFTGEQKSPDASDARAEEPVSPCFSVSSDGSASPGDIDLDEFEGLCQAPGPLADDADGQARPGAQLALQRPTPLKGGWLPAPAAAGRHGDEHLQAPTAKRRRKAAGDGVFRVPPLPLTHRLTNRAQELPPSGAKPTYAYMWGKGVATVACQEEKGVPAAEICAAV